MLARLRLRLRHIIQGSVGTLSRLSAAYWLCRRLIPARAYGVVFAQDLHLRLDFFFRIHLNIFTDVE